jgi:hypothetical protein
MRLKKCWRVSVGDFDCAEMAASISLRQAAVSGIHEKVGTVLDPI